MLYIDAGKNVLSGSGQSNIQLAGAIEGQGRPGAGWLTSLAAGGGGARPCRAGVTARPARATQHFCSLGDARPFLSPRYFSSHVVSVVRR